MSPCIISVIVPCRNEQFHIDMCLASIARFTLPPGIEMEVLVVDGLSDDGTRNKVRTWMERDSRFRLLANPARIQSTALNLGIKAAAGAFIMRLDAHTEYPRDYLQRCHETATRTSADNVGGLCITEVKLDTFGGCIVQALTTHKFGVGDSGFRTGAAEGRRDTVPFGFFRRAIFDRVGFFDERLVRCQDYEMNRRIGAAGGCIWLNPEIQCRYYNQTGLWKFFRKQLLLEAPFNAYMWYLAPYAFAARHAITGVFALGVLGGMALSPLTQWIAWPFAAVMTLYALLAVASAVQQAVRYRNFLHVFCLPPCFFLYHFIHGLGVLTGLLRLLIRTAPVQKIQEPWPGAGYQRIPARRLRLHATTSELS